MKTEQPPQTEPQTYKQRIEALADQWSKINSTTEWNNWAEKVRAEKFGTHGTIPIFDVIKNTEVKFEVSFVQESFINEIKDALNGIKL